MATKQGLISASAGSTQLAEASQTFMALHQAVYKQKYLKPKHHWLMDVSPQILRVQVALDAFVIERQHLLVKAVAEHIRNTSDFEQSVLSSVATIQLRNARELVIGDTLLGATTCLAEMPHVVVAKTMSIFHMTVSAGEVIFKGHCAATVIACAREYEDLFFFVAPLAKVEEVTSQASRFRPTSAFAVWRAVEVRQCNAWRAEPDGVLLVLGL